ncbi:MAG: gliding motility-associated C-terminal domain-containing protein [Saprospiraceae bacterium]|nr:gliding motility-associated C-terminal domain-containing protein [Saprospiraceae bacterium]
MGTKYLWKNSKQTVLDSVESLQYIVRKNETLTCTVSQDSFCDANCIYKIKISDTPKIFIPNVISPNEDGNNDYLEIYGNQHQLLLLQIFDRWGNRIYSTTDPLGKWDGLVNNQKVNPGTYVWLIRYIDLRDNKEKVLNGDVTVVRE